MTDEAEVEPDPPAPVAFVEHVTLTWSSRFCDERGYPRRIVETPPL